MWSSSMQESDGRCDVELESFAPDADDMPTHIKHSLSGERKPRPLLKREEVTVKLDGRMGGGRDWMAGLAGSWR
jgi:hypothetical protein